MPGPGQGKHSPKRKRCKNTFNLNANIVAVNTIMTASSIMALSMTTVLPTLLLPSDATAIDTHTSKMAANTAYTALLPATTETTVDAATLSTNNETSQLLHFTYSHEEVQQLLEDAKLDGWQAGFEEGHRTRRKTGHKEGKEEGHTKGHTEGYEYGYDMCWRISEHRQEEAHKKG
jgi:hypothetical protein